MGREAVKNGIALGRTLYLGHGTRATASDAFVFEDSDHMKSEGFELYCEDLIHRPPVEDSSKLSKHTRAAGIAFAATCAITAASSCMKEANREAFTRSMGAASTQTELDKLSLGMLSDLLSHYIRLPAPDGITKVLNLEKPGTNDLLSVFLGEVTKQIRDKAVGFQRTGTLGFDVIAVPLARETVLAIRQAAQMFGWS